MSFFVDGMDCSRSGCLLENVVKKIVTNAMMPITKIILCCGKGFIGKNESLKECNSMPNCALFIFSAVLFL